MAPVARSGGQFHVGAFSRDLALRKRKLDVNLKYRTKFYSKGLQQTGRIILKWVLNNI